jgi:hypothetical protein
MRIAGDGLHGWRLRGLVVVLWRAGLRIDEALALREADLDRRRGSILVRRGKGGRRREIGMDDWAGRNSSPGSLHGSPCRSVRCSASSTDAPAVARGPPVGHAASCDAPPCEPAFADASLPHQLRHAHAVEMAREGIPLIVIQRQLGHSNLGSPRSICRDRQRRNHRNRSLPPRPNGAGHRLAARRAGHDLLTAAGRAREPARPRPRCRRPPIRRPTLPSGNRRAPRRRKQQRAGRGGLAVGACRKASHCPMSAFAALGVERHVRRDARRPAGPGQPPWQRGRRRRPGPYAGAGAATAGGRSRARRRCATAS